MFLIGVAIVAIGCLVVVIVVSLWLRPKPDATKTTTKTEQAQITDVVDITPLEAAAAEALKGAAARLRAIQAEITRLRDDLAGLDDEARKIDSGIIKGILMKHLDRAAAGDAARIASANLLNAEAARLLSGNGPSQPIALLLDRALTEEQAARRLTRQLERDTDYVRHQVEIRNEMGRRWKP
jgi:hypothetical protein